MITPGAIDRKARAKLQQINIIFVTTYCNEECKEIRKSLIWLGKFNRYTSNSNYS